MQQISEVLRHQSTDSTQIYAKVDFKRLRSLAPPWPQAWNPGGTILKSLEDAVKEYIIIAVASGLFLLRIN